MPPRRVACPAKRVYNMAELQSLQMQVDIASTVFWYQAEPHAPFPPLPDANGLEVI